MSQVRDAVCAAIHEISGTPESMIRDGNSIEGLGVDSLDQIDLYMKIEDKLRVKLDDNEASKCKEVWELVRYVESIRNHQ